MAGDRGLEASREVEAGWALLTRVGARLCAVPLAHAVETMRLLPVSPLGGAPPFVRGLTIIRGLAVPVVDLGVLLGEPAGAATRLVLVRVEERHGVTTAAARPAMLGGPWPARAVGVRAVDLGPLPGPTSNRADATAPVEGDAALASVEPSMSAAAESPPERCVALAVDGVLGVVHLDPAALQSTPPLAQAAGAEMLAAVGALDAQLLVVLGASQLLTEETWQQLGLAAQ